MRTRNVDQLRAALKSAGPIAAVIGRVDNLRGFSASVRAECQAAMLEAVRVHGPDPCTRGQAAAHEAGHVVVAWTFGQQLEAARIDPVRHGSRTAWVGATQMDLPGRGEQLTRAHEDPSFAFRKTLDALAGACGEIQAGLHHPASSVDELFCAGVMCAEVGRVLEIEPTHVMTAAIALCDVALTTNAVQFEVVRAQLATRRRLSSAGAPLLARGERLQWDSLAWAALQSPASAIQLPPNLAALAQRAKGLGSLRGALRAEVTP